MSDQKIILSRGSLVEIMMIYISVLDDIANNPVYHHQVDLDQMEYLSTQLILPWSNCLVFQLVEKTQAIKFI